MWPLGRSFAGIRGIRIHIVGIQVHHNRVAGSLKEPWTRVFRPPGRPRTAVDTAVSPRGAKKSWTVPSPRLIPHRYYCIVAGCCVVQRRTAWDSVERRRAASYHGTTQQFFRPGQFWDPWTHMFRPPSPSGRSWQRSKPPKPRKSFFGPYFNS